MNRRDTYLQRHHCSISDDDLERTLPRNPQSMATVARCIGIHWRVIGHHLGLMEVDAEDIDAARGTEQKAYKMLTTWRTRRGKDAKLGVLLDACSNADTRAVIDDICKERGTIFDVSITVAHLTTY